MKLNRFTEDQTQPVIQLYTDVFAASEGETEGKVIGELVANLITTTSVDDLLGFVARVDDRIAGCIFFSRFTVPDGSLAFLLSPVAVATQLQGTGIGQRLIRYGLNQLKIAGAELVFTYGDPNYYSRVGFQQIDESCIRPPYPLSQPIGWMAQLLEGGDVPSMSGQTQCVSAFSDPAYW
ncbi:MAG: N-acetyltransferase [Candidatus Pelagadaptatus aseana]|uniref:GNAT family N-acetyltransferase n=1 Tax=Candidatus Pelagadaptatus aseana TaxID=3120508 RepID=UPI0039B13268